MRHKIKTAFPILLLLGVFSCHNQPWDFPDYKFSGTYFPYQTPVRTLVLGDYDEVDNTRDQNLQFSIGVALGGMYDNGKDRKVGYVLDETLTQNLYTSAGDTLVPLPQAYYTLSPAGTMVIPKGSLQGYIDVQLKDAFLDDPRAFKNRYVIPLRMTSTEADSILSGSTLVSNPDRRIATDWTIAPKDFTLYGIKFINPYHGHFLYRGKAVMKNAGGTKVDEVVYRNKFVEKNAVIMMTTTGRTQVDFTAMVRRTEGSPGNFKARLTFDAQGSACTVTTAPGSAYPVTGTGKFIKEGDEWGGKKRNTIILAYNYFLNYTAPPPPAPISTVNDNDASIVYTGSWAHDTEAASYGGNRSYSGTLGSYFTFNFTGDGIALYSKTGPSYGNFDIYLDNVKIAAEVSTVTPTMLYQQKVYENLGLSYGPHTLKVVTTKAVNTIFDYLVYTATNPPQGLPSGTYTFEANDTLVVRDRAVVLETFNPVIK